MNSLLITYMFGDWKNFRQIGICLYMFQNFTSSIILPLADATIQVNFAERLFDLNFHFTTPGESTQQSKEIF